MKVLFIIDPIKRLEWDWDNSLALLKEFVSRGHRCWITDIPDIWATEKSVYALATPLMPSRKAQAETPGFTRGIPERFDAARFDLIMIRKEPPFNPSYYYLTLLLERLKGKTVISNDPKGIRNTNEKLGTFLLPRRVPRSLVTSSVLEVLRFRKTIGAPIVLKPLNKKGGNGIRLLDSDETIRRELPRILRRCGQPLLFQERLLNRRGTRGDKRILVLGGKIIGAYEKHPPENDFRTNLSLYGTSHPTRLTASEKKLVTEIRPYLLTEGLHLVGLDVMEGRLLDFNVTCPAGLTVAKSLYPQQAPVRAWADFLERLLP
jgi:glutathione synthase